MKVCEDQGIRIGLVNGHKDFAALTCKFYGVLEFRLNFYEAGQEAA